jgi:threonine dehydratase
VDEESSIVLSLEALRAAHDLVRQALQPTPALAWPLLARRLGAEIVVKHENHNPTGAFKVRGGLTYVDALRRRAPEVAGLIAATRGNHGQSLAFAGRRFGIPVAIVAPKGNSAEKNAAMRALGAELIEYGEDFQAAREEAMRLAGARGLHSVPSFHRDLVLGVATYALELFADRPDLECLYVPIGLGSGICGCIAARDALGLETEIVGVQSTEAPSYALSLTAGRSVSTEACDTLADGMATRVPDDEALAIIQRGVSRIVLVSDAEIGEAIRAYWTDTHNLAEGAGAAALAAAFQERGRLARRRVGVILTGGNIDIELFRGWVAAPERVVDAPSLALNAHAGTPL